MSNPEDFEGMIEDYLDGILSPAETARVERMLFDPEISRLLSEALMLRELLATAPPNEVPEGLVARIEAELGVAEGGRRKKVRASRVRGALDGAAWALRWPSLAFAAPPGAVEGSRQGLGTVRYALGPLGTTRRADRSRRRSARSSGEL